MRFFCISHEISKYKRYKETIQNQIFEYRDLMINLSLS